MRTENDELGFIRGNASRFEQIERCIFGRNLIGAAMKDTWSEERRVESALFYCFLWKLEKEVT